MLIKVSQMPDWGRRAIRLSLSLGLFASIAIWLWPVPESLRAEWGDEVRQTCNWAGASCAVVAASPLIGKVSQLSYERTLGTLTGGLLGFLTYDYIYLTMADRWSEAAADAMLVVAVAAVGFLSCYLSNRFKLDASMRLFVITFLIVTFGGAGEQHSALGVALLRTGGICAGVLLLMSLTVVILPKSATIESLREMKSGLKLLSELNTLVWTSKAEAEAAIKTAAAKARAAEAAAAATAAAEAGGSAPRQSLVSRVMQQLWFTSSPSQTASRVGGAPETQPLLHHGPDDDPEAGLLGQSTAPAAPAVPRSASARVGGVPHIRGVGGGPSSKADLHGNPTQVSQLTQALLTHNGGSSSYGRRMAVQQQQSQQQQQEQGEQAAAAYDSFMRSYEERCEDCLTRVYSSMFKVKEHVALAESEAYVYHFYGHYIFVPLFFSGTCVRWIAPNRWRLPTAQMDRLATSIRVIARLLWTVHLDYSEAAFDEVLQALPASANMSNLLLDLGEGLAAALGVLVESFPNKSVILVDKLAELDQLVDRMLEISGGAQHEKLIRELAANRANKAGRSTLQSDSNGGSACGAPVTSSAFAAPQQQLGAAGLASYACSHLEGRPGAAAVATAASGQRRHLFGGVAAAARLGASPAAASSSAAMPAQRAVPFVTYEDAPGSSSSCSRSHLPGGGHASWGGVGPPLPAESPELACASPPAQDAQQLQQPVCGAGCSVLESLSAARTHSTLSQGELLFDLGDLGGPSPAAPTAAAAAAAAAATAAAAPQEAGSVPQQPQQQPQAPGSVSGSLIKAQFNPLAVVAAVKLQKPVRLARAAATAAGTAAAAAPAAGAAAAPAKDGHADSACALPPCMRALSTPDPAVANAAAALLSEQQQQHAEADRPPQPPPPSQPPGSMPGSSLQLPALADPETVGMVKLTRFYSFQFLVLELLQELHELYHHLRNVMAVLPHGL